MTQYRRVQVTWRDAESASGWFDVNVLTGRIEPVATIGWLISSDDDTLLIAGSLGGEGLVGDISRIPMDWTTKVEDI